MAGFVPCRPAALRSPNNHQRFAQVDAPIGGSHDVDRLLSERLGLIRSASLHGRVAQQVRPAVERQRDRSAVEQVSPPSCPAIGPTAHPIKSNQIYKEPNRRCGHAPKNQNQNKQRRT